ncbi:phospholipase A2 inhibitor and Ly6/PLAUR domain-containing protein-like isoform X2 [Pseudophryne corroboree]|uniref:phospholipase A2 inhibitor and Ly6/PLAUR domain-containing protein-like isoform X2 n=1 Tax=Pseudophryne corroboree TaxID=495146 RepID=UPI00308145E7
MGYIFTLLCISGLLSAGHSLTCVVCRSEEAFTCTGEERVCPKDYVCASTSTVTIMEGRATKTFTRSCERRNTCGTAGSIGYQRGKIKTAISCCYSDSCYPSNPALPPDDAQRNGLSCRSCTSHDSIWCHTSETIDCTGQENKCIFQTDVYSGAKYGKTAVRGCGTKAICDIGSQTHNYGGTNLRREITCSNDGFSLRSSLLLLAITVASAFRLML